MAIFKNLARNLSFFAFLRVASALPWPGAQSTDAAATTAAWSPKPTSQSIGQLSLPELFRRQAPNLFSDNQACGWITQPTTNLIVTCSPSSSCAFNTDISRVGCCDQRSSCTFYTSCIDADSTKNGDHTDIYTCLGTSVCYENTYPNGFKQYGCGQATWATQVVTFLGSQGVQIVITGEAAGPTTEGVVTVTQPPTTVIETSLEPAATSSSSPFSSSSSDNQQAAATSVTTGPAPSPSKSGVSSTARSASSTLPNGEAASQSSKPTQTTTPIRTTGLTTGAKAGIGAGAAVIALIAGTLILICCRRRHHDNAAELQGTSISPWGLSGKSNAANPKSSGPPLHDQAHEKFGTPVQESSEVYGSPVPSQSQFDPESVRSSTVRSSTLASPTAARFSDVYELDNTPGLPHDEPSGGESTHYQPYRAR